MFQDKYEKLTPRQKEILIPFLANKEDGEIAAMLHCTTANVRFHLSRIFRVFDLVDGKGDRCRHDLVDLFVAYRPDLVDPGRSAAAGYRPSIAPVRPDIPGRPMSLGSPLYIQPTFEARCCEEVLVPGQLLRIRAPQTTGKTSLLYRILNHAQRMDYRTIALNLRYDVDASDLTSLATFLAWFCRAIALRLNRPINTLPTNKLDCTNYLQNEILLDLETPLVIALDEVEVLFDHWAIAQEFFPLLRGWHESAKEPGLEMIWEKLRLVIVHSTDAYIRFSSSPFENVGHVVGLDPLQLVQVQKLAHHYGLQNLTASDVDRLMALVGGHPYLIQQALYSLAKGGITLDDLLVKAPTLDGIYRSHLQELVQRLYDATPQSNLVEALKQVITTTGNVRLTLEQLFKLRGLGLLQSDVTPISLSCDLYRRFFQDWL